MIYLFSGDRGSLSPLLAAFVYLGKDPLEDSLFFNFFYDIKEGETVFIDFDSKGNRVYVMKARNYRLLPIICTELEKVAGKEERSLRAIPVEIKGEKLAGALCYWGKRVMGHDFGIFFLKNWLKKSKTLEGIKRVLELLTKD